MGTSGRLLIATALSLVLLLIYDKLVIRPRIEKQKATQNQSQKTEEKISAEQKEQNKKKDDTLGEFIDMAKAKPSVSAVFKDDFQYVQISDRGIGKIELSKFALSPNSEQNYKFDSPLDILFISNGKIIDFSASLSGDTINLSYDSITGVIKFEKISNYSFSLKYEFFNSSTFQVINITPVFILRKSVIDDSKLVVVSSKVEELKELDNKQNLNFIGEDSRYFSFIFYVPGGVNHFGSEESNVFYGTKLIGERYVDFYVKFFAGPKIPEELSKFSENTRVVAGYGFLSPISEFLVFSLEKINKIVQNMGFSIIILSFIIRVLFFPLSAVSFKSFKKIKDIQPEIEKIKEKYKDDKEKMSREIFELYRREKVNPFSGCLPLLIQIPIFIALYNALMHSVDLRHAPFVLWIKDLSEPDSLYALQLGGMNISIRLLPIIMGLSFLVQQVMTPQTYQDKTMKIFNYLMPIMFIFILWNVPSGLQVYWITTNIVGLIQQFFVMKFYK